MAPFVAIVALDVRVLSCTRSSRGTAAAIEQRALFRTFASVIDASFRALPLHLAVGPQHIVGIRIRMAMVVFAMVRIAAQRADLACTVVFRKAFVGVTSGLRRLQGARF